MMMMMLRTLIIIITFTLSSLAQTLIKLNISEWTDLHNELRRKEPASNMQEMVWDRSLAKLAESWVRKCKWGHSPESSRQRVLGYENIGENIFVVTFPQPTAVTLREWWYDWEVPNYNARTKGCRGGECRHYTQMIWADSCAIGCAMAHCRHVDGFGYQGGYYVSCTYGPSGNWIGSAPFRRGKTCADCPGKCHNGLCESLCISKNTVYPSHNSTVSPWRERTAATFPPWRNRWRTTTKQRTTKKPTITTVPPWRNRWRTTTKQRTTKRPTAATVPQWRNRWRTTTEERTRATTKWSRNGRGSWREFFSVNNRPVQSDWITTDQKTTTPITTTKKTNDIVDDLREQRPSAFQAHNQQNGVCRYTEWKRWDRCSVDCGEGRRSRTRNLILGNAAECTRTSQSILCLAAACKNRK